jgi:hypothetical protein
MLNKFQLIQPTFLATAKIAAFSLLQKLLVKMLLVGPFVHDGRIMSFFTFIKAVLED